MKVITSIAAMLCVASSALAAWTYDAQTKQASDGNWILQLHPMPAGGGLQLGNSNNSGSAIVQMPEDRNLDLSTFYADTDYKIYGIYQSGFRGTHIASLIAPDVTNINSQAFYDCTNLTRLVFSDNLSGAGNSAFYNCPRLVEFSPAVCPISTISAYIFQGCSKLKTEFNFPKATSIGSSAFRSSGITGVTAENVVSMGSEAFRNNEAVKYVYLPKCKATSDKNFWGCYGLTNAVFSLEMTKLSANAFYKCNALKSFTPFLSDKLTSTGDGSAFNGCSVLTGSLRIASEALTSISHSVFLGAAGGFIGPVEIYSPIETIGDNAFNSCKDLQVFNFYSDVTPSFGANSIKAKKTRVIINVHSNKAIDGWRALCTGNSETFETMKSNSDYPGRKTIGVLLCGGQYHWVVDCSPPKGTSIVIL